MKKRFIALTDIYRKPGDKQIEIDDVESMIRLLLYSNEIDIEGLIPTSSCFYKGGNEYDRQVILDIIDAYETVKPNLDKHADGYPSPDALRSVTVCGIPRFGRSCGNGFGEEKYNDNPGVNRIIDAVDKDDPRPVWVGLWGGANTLAQAVWKAWKTRTETEFNTFLSKLRVYGISDQDRGGVWMRRMFGDRLFYIVSPSAGTALGAAAFVNSTWFGFAGDGIEKKYMHPKQGCRGAQSALVAKPWLRENICGDTPYRKIYPLPTVAMEGDTPTYLGLIQNGLQDMEHPDWGSWGGRYELYLPDKAPPFAKKELYPLWTDVVDTVELADGTTETSNYATIWRWRESVQRDFAARMCWTEADDYKKANHAPIVQLKTPTALTVKCGEQVPLSAQGTYDPDGDSLFFRWFNYKEAGSYHTVIAVENADQIEATFTAPDEPCSLHFILEVKDSGAPSMTSYARILVTVNS